MHGSSRRLELLAKGRKRGAFKAGDARTIAAAIRGGLASAASRGVDERCALALASRRWWAQFSPEQRRAITRARLKNYRHTGGKKGWTLEVDPDHPGLTAMRANGIRSGRLAAARTHERYSQRVIRAHCAYYFQHHSVGAIAEELHVTEHTVGCYLRVPLTWNRPREIVVNQRRK
jgi:hypothetical protein